MPWPRTSRRIGILSMLLASVALAPGAGVVMADGNPARKTSPGRASAGQATRAPEAEAMRVRARAWLDQQLAALDKAQEITVTRRSNRHDEYRRRIRATYRLSRPGSTPVWLDRDARAARATQRSAARRSLARDQAEIAILDDEIAAIARSRQRIEAEREHLDALDLPAPRSLRNPVAWSRVAQGFGLYRESQSRALLSRRGIWLTSQPGRNIRAVAPGTVRYAGAVRHLGQVVVVDHGDHTSVLGDPGTGSR